jgi:hypothetical protein
MITNITMKLVTAPLCGSLISLGCLRRQPFSLLDKKKTQRRRERERERETFYCQTAVQKKAGVTASLQIIKVNLCGLFVLFIEHKTSRPVFSPCWLLNFAKVAGRPTQSFDLLRHQFYL